MPSLRDIRRRIASVKNTQQMLHDELCALGIRTRPHHPVLGALQLGRRHHLHGIGDLLRIFNAPDPVFKVSSGGHDFLTV